MLVASGANNDYFSRFIGVETFANQPSLGRFTLRDEGKTIGELPPLPAVIAVPAHSDAHRLVASPRYR